MYEHVTPLYATDWRTIGALLGLRSEEIKIIEYDNVSGAIPCCNAMWQKWLEVDATATWEKLFAAIRSPLLYRSTLTSAAGVLTKGNYGISTMTLFICIH